MYSIGHAIREKFELEVSVASNMEQQYRVIFLREVECMAGD